MNKELASWLIDNNVASFSPQTGMLLLRIADETIDAMVKDKKLDGDLEIAVQKYIDSLRYVAGVGGDHQGAVIAKLSALLGDPAPGWTGEKVP